MDLVERVGRFLSRNKLPLAGEAEPGWFNPDNWDPNTTEQLIQLLRYQKVGAQAYKNSQYLQERHASPLLQAVEDAFTPRFQQLQGLRALIPSLRSEIRTALEAAGLRGIFIKGSALLPYPEGYIREMGDIDFMVQSWDDLFRVTAVLHEAGYSLGGGTELPWMSRWTLAGTPSAQLSGHLNLFKDAEGYEINVDLHTVTYLVGMIGVLECDLWTNRETQHSWTPSLEDMLLILIAHAVNHGFFLFKDYNDTYAIIQGAGSGLDWDYVCHSLEASSLEYAGVALLQRVARDYGPLESVDPAIRRLSKRSHRLAARLLLDCSDRKVSLNTSEILINALHTHIWARAHHGRIKAMTLTAELLLWRLRYGILQHNMLGAAVGDHEVTRWLLHRSQPHLTPFPRYGQQLIIIPIEMVLDEDHPLLTKDAGAVFTALAADQASAADLPGCTVLPLGETALAVKMDRVDLLVTAIGLFVPSQDAIFNTFDMEQYELLATLLSSLISTSRQMLAGPTKSDTEPVLGR